MPEEKDVNKNIYTARKPNKEQDIYEGKLQR